jgi:phosphoribosylformimino-5-aminoimidazole carboxamide ribotide isomerase
MIRVIPAIDLYEGKVVRLHRGNYDQMTVYSEDPVSYAADFYEMGARYLHIIDLEGAKIGKPAHLDVLEKIASEIPVKIEYGGGLRSAISIEDALEAGAERAIISTRALTDLEFLKVISEVYNERIALSIDVKDGMVYVKGWQEPAMNIEQALKLVAEYRIPHLIFTDIDRDGTNQGVNFEFVEKVLKLSPVPVTIAGGISSEEDVFELSKYETFGLEGIIIGKAYYDGLIDLNRVFERLPQESC